MAAPFVLKVVQLHKISNSAQNNGSEFEMISSDINEDLTCCVISSLPFWMKSASDSRTGKSPFSKVMSLETSLKWWNSQVRRHMSSGR
jgi:hypothetical protein